jgi:hypothetical protein
LTSAWSIDSEPSRRSEQAIATTPLAKHWQKVLTDEHEGEETWTHLYVDSAPWKTGVLDNLLRVVADDEIRDAFMAPTNFEWLYHPYDGGADVIAPTPKMRDLIRDGHRAWLSKHPEGL